MKDKSIRIQVLEKQHVVLDEKIKVLFKRYAKDEQIETLKRQKLSIKDEIARLQKELDNGQ